VPATQRFAKTTPQADLDKSPSALMDRRIAELADWRGELLARLRDSIRAAAAFNKASAAGKPRRAA